MIDDRKPDVASQPLSALPSPKRVHRVLGNNSNQDLSVRD
ncbi:hypothetical protein Vi05172_g155 [Venturia inaequalis]|nr:hypothetical protein Vi05172_g155 [Venturia inaequalis]